MPIKIQKMRANYLIALLIAIKVSAQDPKSSADTLSSMFENQIESLDLNESQKIQFKEINDQYLIKLESIKNSGKAKFEKI